MAETITSIASLLWPLLILLVVLLFRRPLLRVVRTAEHREWSIEVGGQTLTMKQLSDQQSTMIADLQNQIGELRAEIAALTADQRPVEEVPAQHHGPVFPPADAGYRWPQPQPGALPSGGELPPELPWSPPQATSAPALAANPVANSVLWVDDNPENNALIIERLQRNGVRVDLARTTREALASAGRNRYGAVLSGMGRFEDRESVPDAGLRLLHAIRNTDPAIPFLIFCGNRPADAYHDTAKAAGANLITASPTELSNELRNLGLL
ncbi:response regulator [Saccharomonospora sp. NPDC006951]